MELELFVRLVPIKAVTSGHRKEEFVRNMGQRRRLVNERDAPKLFKVGGYVGCMEPQRRLVRGKGVLIMSSRKEESAENMVKGYRLIFAAMSAVLSGYKRGVYAQVMERRDKSKVIMISLLPCHVPSSYAYFTSTPPTLTKAPLPLCAIACSRQQLHLFPFSLVDFHP